MLTQLKEKIFGNDSQKLNYTKAGDQSRLAILHDQFTMIRSRIPYLLEQNLGLNMSYEIMSYVPNLLITSELRKATKNNNLAEIKNKIYLG